MTWLEAVPPLVIITCAIAGIGTMQGVVHRAFHDGKDKRVQRDYFSYQMERRDTRLAEEKAEAEKAAGSAS